MKSEAPANERTLMHLRFLERAQMIEYPLGSATPDLAHDVIYSLCAGADSPGSMG